MDRVNQILKGMALATIPVVGAFICLLLLQVSEAVRKGSDGVQQVIAEANTAMETVNAPCKDNGHQVTCGTLASVAQTTKNVGILAAQGAEQVKQSGQLITATTRNLDAVGASVTGTMGHLDLVADAAQTTIATTGHSVAELTGKASAAIQTTNASIAGLQPMEANATASTASLKRFLDTLPPITANVNTITHDAVVEEQKYVYPPKKKWYQKIGQTILVSGRIAYHFFY